MDLDACQIYCKWLNRCIFGVGNLEGLFGVKIYFPLFWSWICVDVSINSLIPCKGFFSNNSF